MRVFVTGGTGYIGAHIVTELLRAGDEATLLARNPVKVPSFVGQVGFVQGSLGDMDAIRAALVGHEALIHNAIWWEDEESLTDVRASARLFDVAGESGVEQILYTSSTAVHRPFREGMTEEDRLMPADLYGATKACGEALLWAASQRHSMRANVIRPGPTVGTSVEGTTANGDRRLVEFLETARRGGDIQVKGGDGRQFTPVSDLARLYSAVLRAGVNRETYLAVSPELITWEEIARMAIEIAGSISRVVVEPPSSSPGFFEVAKIQREFGIVFDARAAIREHLKDCYETLE
jgi:UDP-glucose 4-epimerase